MKNFLILLLIFSTYAGGQGDQRAYYKALESEEQAILDSKIQELEKVKSSTLVNAYKGALIAKKACFLKGMKEKLDTFKQGVDLLETAIEKYPKNWEYRFLRLSVQENCPKILKYNGNIDEDKKHIVANFSSLKDQLQQIIRDYARSSSILDPKELQ